MARTVRLQDTVDAGLIEGVDALAKATGRRRAEVIEQALRLILDPLPALVQAQATLAAYQQRTTMLEDRIKVIADYVVDASREREEM